MRKYQRFVECIVSELLEEFEGELELESDVDKYHKGLQLSNQQNPGFVTVHPKEKYSSSGAKVFVHPESKYGYALLPHTDNSGRIEIAGLYNTGGKETAGVGKKLLHHAISQGGNYLEAFEGDDKFSLPHFYASSEGFKPTSYFPWDEKYKPEGWKGGESGVVAMDLPKQAKSDSRAADGSIGSSLTSVKMKSDPTLSVFRRQEGQKQLFPPKHYA
jgi:hypothetical protein